MFVFNAKLVNSMNTLFELIRFGIVGVLAMSTHLAVAYVFLRILMYGNVYIVNFMAFMVAIVIAYLGHFYITFKKEGKFLRYASVSVFGFFINNLLLYLGLYLSMDYFFAIILSVLPPPLIVYVLSKYWVFVND